MWRLKLINGGIYFRNGNGTEVAVVAYLDCIHEPVSIIFIVFIGNILLSGALAYWLASYSCSRVHAVAAG